MEGNAKYLVDKIGQAVQIASAETQTTIIPVDRNITGVHYLYDRYEKITEKLQSKADSEFKYRRYPLIALVFPQSTDHGPNEAGGTATLNFIICHHTTADRYMPDRMRYVFKPILFPIRDAFLQALVDCGHFMITDTQAIQYTEVIHPHWGENEGYVFDDCLDAIELKNMKLKLY